MRRGAVVVALVPAAVVAAALTFRPAGPRLAASTMDPYSCLNPQTGECRLVVPVLGQTCESPWVPVASCGTPTPTPTREPWATPAPGAGSSGRWIGSAVLDRDTECDQADILSGEEGTVLLRVDFELARPSTVLALADFRWLAVDPTTTAGDRVAVWVVDGEARGSAKVQDSAPNQLWQTPGAGHLLAALPAGPHWIALRFGGCCGITGHPYRVGAGSLVDVVDLGAYSQPGETVARARPRADGRTEPAFVVGAPSGADVVRGSVVCPGRDCLVEIWRSGGLLNSIGITDPTAGWVSGTLPGPVEVRVYGATELELGAVRR